MTQEEKAKCYDYALTKARNIVNSINVGLIGKDSFEAVFPELKDSDDEKIKKSLIILLQHFCKGYRVPGLDFPVSYKDMLAWLEKQGEQKPDDTNNRFIRMRETKPKDISEFLDRLTTVEQEFLWEHIAKIRELGKEEQKPADKVEPKFKIGDWVVYDHRAYKVVALPKEGCINLGLKRNGKLEFAPFTYCRPWTIADAKDGDVLTYSDSRNNVYLCIYKEYKNERVYDYCTLDKESFWEYGNWNYLASFNYAPATKEQRDTLEKAMADAGYTFDFVKKELKEIKNPTTWSEEDSPYYDDICEILINLLHSETADVNKGAVQKDLDWLKSLRPQSTWKPSDEQMDMLKIAVSTSNSVVLDSLYDQLKILKGE